MNKVEAIVEGQTEQTFIRDQLAEHLGLRGVSIWSVLPGWPRRRGGVPKWRVVRDDIIRSLKRQPFCTTMFDFYGMPDDWPGREAAAALPWDKRAEHVQEAMGLDIAQTLGASFSPGRFLPYVQLHEFEALAFAGVAELAEVTAPLSRASRSRLRTKFELILDEAGSPEAIDDGAETCPSRRLLRVVGQSYRKRVHGPIITNRIGLDRLRKACPHFGDWLNRLESLGDPAGG
ncbi:MAG: DUF4276 family protein [Phycisphaeraceae bacterium]|nr:DUF4276 family protein [Phycisphaeraceae bacterium]